MPVLEFVSPEELVDIGCILVEEANGLSAPPDEEEEPYALELPPMLPEMGFMVESPSKKASSSLPVVVILFVALFFEEGRGRGEMSFLAKTSNS